MAGMDALSESAEMMIKNINQLAANEKRVRTSDLANKTELKPATVTEMIQRLGDLGLVDYKVNMWLMLLSIGLIFLNAF